MPEMLLRTPSGRVQTSRRMSSIWLAWDPKFTSTRCTRIVPRPSTVPKPIWATPLIMPIGWVGLGNMSYERATCRSRSRRTGSEIPVVRFKRRESSGVSLLTTKTSLARRSASADFCSSTSCWTQSSQPTPMLKINTVRVPPPGLMGKFSPSESDNVNEGAGRPMRVLTSTETPGPPSGPGKTVALENPTVPMLLTGVLADFGPGRVMSAGIKMASATPTPTRSPRIKAQFGRCLEVVPVSSLTLVARS